MRFRRGAVRRSSASLPGSGPHFRRSMSTAEPCEQAVPCPCRAASIRLREVSLRNRDGEPSRYARAVATCTSTCCVGLQRVIVNATVKGSVEGRHRDGVIYAAGRNRNRNPYRVLLRGAHAKRSIGNADARCDFTVAGNGSGMSSVKRSMRKHGVSVGSSG